MITHERLFVTFDFKVKSVVGLFIFEEIGHHGYCVVDCVLDSQEKTDPIYSMTSSTNVKVIFRSNNLEEILFSGIPLKIKEKHINGVYMFRIILGSYSTLMDYKRKRRSFQDPAGSIDDIFKEIMGMEYGRYINYTGRKEMKQYPVIQYDETDWTFLKRMASHLDAKLTAFCKSSKTDVFIGIPSGNTYEEKNINYAIEKDVTSYLINKSKKNDWQEKDFIYHEVLSRQNYSIGDKTKLNDIVLTIYQKKSRLEKGILNHYYRLKKENSLKENMIYNENLKGLSIKGKVLDRNTDFIKLHLEIDEKQEKEKAYFFKVDTPYTTEGNTGWYIMPELNSELYLYIKSKDERESCIRRENRMDGKTNKKTQDPTIKYLGTVHKNEIKMSKKELIISEVENEIFIEMTHGEGIKIKSNKDIVINSEKKIYGEAQFIEILSEDSILATTDNANVIVDKIVHMRGR